MSEDQPINRTRIHETRRDLINLRRDFELWHHNRTIKDKLQQYHSQLGILNRVMSSALERLKTQLDVSQASQPIDRVYRSCRAVDQGLVFLKRVWDYYRSKFDQRDHAELRDVLAAADEVVWSCYAEAFRSARVDCRPAPLPYIDAKYSPEAQRRCEPPPDLQATSPELREFFKEMPIPVISLPPVTVESPWWLIFLGHEVGHQVEQDLIQVIGPADGFRKALRSAATGEPDPKCDEASAQDWESWAEEIFADAFSVCTMGQWAVWAMARLEISDGASMIRKKAKYPPPVVRLSLLREMVSAVRKDDKAGRPSLSDFEFEPGDIVRPKDEDKVSSILREKAASNLAMTPKIAAAAISMAPDGKKPLAELCGWRAREFEAKGDVYNWSKGLLGTQPLFVDKALRAPRLIACAAVAAWAQIATHLDGTLRDEASDKLRRAFLTHAVESREDGTRAELVQAVTKAQATALEDRLADLLKNAADAD